MAKKKLLIAAVVVGLFAALMVWLYGQQVQEEKEVYTANQQEVVVAATDIPSGAPLREQDITTRGVPERFLASGALLARDVEIYLDQPLSQGVDAGEMIMTGDFAVSEVSRTLSGRIPTGERAITVPVDAISGVGGLLTPGDRVDLLGTFPIGQEDELIPEASGGESMGYVTMSLLQNVTLLAVGSQISDTSGREHQAGGGYGHVTLSLTPDEAELMVIAQTRGELNMLLRNREDLDQVPVTRRTLREVLEELEILNREREERVQQAPPPCGPYETRNEQGECVREIDIVR